MKIDKVKLWFWDRLHYLLSGGKCLRCGGKLTLNALNFHNCGKCFHEYACRMLGEDPNDF